MEPEGHALEVITLGPTVDAGQTLGFSTQKGVTESTGIIADNRPTFGM